MTYRSASRQLIFAVLVLLLAGVAAPAGAATREGPSGPAAATWDALGWLHSLAQGLLGLGGAGEATGPVAAQDEARANLEPDGNSNDLTATPSDGLERESPLREGRATPK